MAHTCFVISPIGEEGSDVRQHANDLYDLVIEPALQKFGFQVTRADKQATPGVITSEIIKLIQESDLCIIDLTGTNANVMYECGRRQETAKPCIMMMRKGEKLPFDLQGLRTIFYELDTPRNVHKAMLDIQSFVAPMVQEGFVPATGGDSLFSVVETLNRLERKLDSILGQASAPTSLMVSNAENDPVASGQLTAIEAFAIALNEGNIPYAETMLRLIKPGVSEEGFYDRFVEPLCARGSHMAASLLVKRLPQYASLPSDRRRAEMIGSLVSYYNRWDTEQEGLDALKDIFVAVCEDETADHAYRAQMLNQKQRLLVGLGEENYPQCKELLQEAIRLNPMRSSYHYNLAYICYDLGQMIEAEQAITNCLQIAEQASGKLDPDHLEKALQIYKRNGKTELYDQYAQYFKDNHPYKYQLFLLRNA